MIEVKMLEQEEFTLLVFEARGDAPEFADLNALELPTVTGSKGLVIASGKLEPWVTDGAMSHYRNLTLWQGRYVPKKRGARNERDFGVLVIFSTSREYPVGKVLDYRLPCLICRNSGVQNVLRADAIYPYCTQHQNYNPARQTYSPKKAIAKK
ncbi:MAG: hypothetical protein SNJ57_10100 [Cyanobacteriota bacterium]